MSAIHAPMFSSVVDSNVVLLLDGVNFTDQSSYNTSITNTGITTSGGRYQCVGTKQLNTSTNSSNFDIFNNDYTLEMFLNRSSSAYGAVIGSQDANHFLLTMSLGGPLVLYVQATTVFSTPVPSADVEHHIMITHKLSTREVKYYLDGIYTAGGTTIATVLPTNLAVLGETTANSLPTLGYNGLAKVAGVKCTRGVILETSNFTPPAPPFSN
jgi:hypothetical protein